MGRKLVMKKYWIVRYSNWYHSQRKNNALSGKQSVHVSHSHNHKFMINNIYKYVYYIEDIYILYAQEYWIENKNAFKMVKTDNPENTNSMCYFVWNTNITHLLARTSASVYSVQHNSAHSLHVLIHIHNIDKNKHTANAFAGIKFVGSMCMLVAGAVRCDNSECSDVCCSECYDWTIEIIIIIFMKICK